MIPRRSPRLGAVGGSTARVAAHPNAARVHRTVLILAFDKQSESHRDVRPAAPPTPSAPRGPQAHRGRDDGTRRDLAAARPGGVLRADPIGASGPIRSAGAAFRMSVHAAPGFRTPGS